MFVSGPLQPPTECGPCPHPVKADFSTPVAAAGEKDQDQIEPKVSMPLPSQQTSDHAKAHRFALAALRHQGYRSENRIAVFQTLAHTLGTHEADIQVFLRAHNERNLAEYEGRVDMDAKLLADLIRCTTKLEAAVGKLTPPAA